MFDVDPELMSLCDLPFLSGQMSSKCFKSSDGRSLSIGTQYLKRKRTPYEITIADIERCKPYSVQSIVQSPLLRLTTDKLLDNLQLVFIACLESTGIVENITGLICESQFVVDLMLSTLHKQDRQDQPSLRRTSLSNLH
jgi:hypothetical protein